ncbi:hypothetical protein Sste5346_001522 [Sporothrix stenoceras]|uniref:DUF8021 domain-containing protein n=1 Tax=Sporothrix stenoceras TaxID=5173 RepID=A0ABR3ZQN0_9PEZI
MYSSLLTWFALWAASAVVASPIANTSDCTRDFLKAATDTYLAAQTQGTPDTLLGKYATGNITYTEDAIVRNLRTGVLSSPLAIVHNFSLLDTTQCATFTELIVTDPRHPRVIGTQMRFVGKWLAKIETLVTKNGDWAFNATGTLHYAEEESKAGKWGPLQDAERNTREVIQSAADAYLDLFNNKSVVVPWGTPCDRLEGSWYTGNGSQSDSCNVGVPSGVVITNRRYIIDELVGGVDAFVTFGSRPDSHMFRVAAGVIRQVHTLTVMRNVTETTELLRPANDDTPWSQRSKRLSTGTRTSTNDDTPWSKRTMRWQPRKMW